MDKQDQDEMIMPPRRKLHTSNRVAWNRRFYAVLVLLFAFMIVFLIGWFHLHRL